MTICGNTQAGQWLARLAPDCCGGVSPRASHHREEFIPHRALGIKWYWWLLGVAILAGMIASVFWLG